jgi:hypothetical protein
VALTCLDSKQAVYLGPRGADLRLLLFVEAVMGARPDVLSPVPVGYPPAVSGLGYGGEVAALAPGPDGGRVEVELGGCLLAGEEAEALGGEGHRCSLIVLATSGGISRPAHISMISDLVYAGSSLKRVG